MVIDLITITKGIHQHSGQRCAVGDLKRFEARGSALFEDNHGFRKAQCFGEKICQRGVGLSLDGRSGDAHAKNPTGLRAILPADDFTAAGIGSGSDMKFHPSPALTAEAFTTSPEK